MTDPAPPEDHPPELTPLDGVVDDLQSREESLAWACEEFVNGRSAEDLTAELIANGWEQEPAADVVEEARQRTRHLRGVVTREDVARNAARHYRRSIRLNGIVAFPSIAAGWRLVLSIAYLFRNRRRD